jgi:DNA polymerase I-like protein with 3'-5' exonuclease and polymerase domains
MSGKLKHLGANHGARNKMISLPGVHKQRLVIDASSILTACAFVRHDEDETEITFNGKKFFVQDPRDIYETFRGSLLKTLDVLSLQPSDIIFVKDPINSRGNRLRIYPEYKANREPRPQEWYDSYGSAMAQAEGLIKDYGGIIATPKEGYEADDLVAEISNRFRHTVIWTRDRDLQCLAGDIFIEGELNPRHPSGLIEPQHIKVWKTLVSGDASDNVPSVKKFGPKKFEQFLELYGAEGLDEIADMLENDQLHQLNAEELPCLQLILDDAETAYTAWALFTFQHIPAHRVIWEGGVQRFRQEPGFEKWWPTRTLITDENIEAYATKIERALASAAHVALDIETDTPPESKEWLKKNKERIDVFGSELAGCGLTAGPHSFYFSVRHKDTTGVLIEDLKTVLGWIPKETPILCHRAGGFELPILYREFGEDQAFGEHGFLPNVHDTKIAANYVDEVALTGLKSLSKKHLKYHQITYDETIGDRSGMFEVTGQEVLDYGLDDTICTDALWNLFTAIMEYERTLDVFVEVEQTAQYTAALAMHKGVRCDLEKVKELSDRDQAIYDEQMQEFRKHLMNLTWETQELVLDPETGKQVPVATVHRWPGAYFEPLTELNGVQIKRMYGILYGEPFKCQFQKLDKLAEFFTEQPLAEAIAAGDLDRVNAEYEVRWVPDPRFNVNSPIDCSRLMYESLNLPVRVRNKPTPLMVKKGLPGTPSTDEDAIENAIAFGDVKDKEPLFRVLLELKKISTRFSLFFDKYPVLVHWKDGRLHPHLRQSSTSTQRYSHGAPNLAQMPKKKGRELRGMLAADEDYVICTLDITAQELKLQAWDSQDANFLSCYLGENKRNLHSLTGFGILSRQKSREWLTYDEFQAAVDAKNEKAGRLRHQGKETNFSTAYLCFAKKLGILLRISEEKAQEFMDAKAEAFPGLMPHVEDYIKICQKRGYSLTFLGARRHLHVPFAIKDKFWQAKAGRWAWSFRIQGSGGEQTKLIAGSMWESGVFHDYRCCPVTLVHDEVVTVIHKDDVDVVVPILHACVCQPYDGMEIPTESTPEIGPNFADCKPYELKELEGV